MADLSQYVKSCQTGGVASIAGSILEHNGWTAIIRSSEVHAALSE